MNHKAGWQDLLIAIFGFVLASVSLWLYGKTSLDEWIIRFGCYAGTFTMLIYFMSLRIRAEGLDPRARLAFKEYLKLGSFYVFILFTMELPLMLASI